MRCLILRLDAPLMSFGGTVIDQHHPTEFFPGTSLLAGLVGNALGLHHRDAVHLQDLQSRLRHATRWDRTPEPVVDYQTVNLGQPHLVDTGWTTRGRRESRAGASSTGTHIRYRHYWANGCATLAMTLSGPGRVTLDDVEAALRHPARPLFIGRKTCLPSSPMLVRRCESESLYRALETHPPLSPDAQRRVPACWPADESNPDGSEVEVHDLRDWAHQMHLGSNTRRRGMMEISG